MRPYRPLKPGGWRNSHSFLGIKKSARVIPLGLYPYAKPVPVHLVNNPREMSISVEAKASYAAAIARSKTKLSSLGLDPELVLAAMLAPGQHTRIRSEVTPSGKTRTYHIPQPHLIRIQTILIRHWLRHACYFGGKFARNSVEQAIYQGTSILQNTRCHIRHRSSWTVDLKDAFPSLRTNQLRSLVYRSLHGLIGVRHVHKQRKTSWPSARSVSDFALILSRICTFDGRLRLGPPTSPLIFTLMTQNLDRQILHAISPHGVKYTRYVDDLCFSSPAEFFPNEVRQLVIQTCGGAHRELNLAKQRWGQKGILRFPGVDIHHGVPRPNRRYIERLTVAAPTLTAVQRQGHIDYITQYKNGGLTPTLRRLLQL